MEPFESSRAPLRGRTVAILGCGALGRALALAVARRGAKVALWSRNRDRAQELRAVLEALGARARSAPTPTAACSGAGVVILAIADGALGTFAAELAGALPAGTRTPVLHTSGPQGVSVIDALAGVGLPTGKLHPLAALARASDPAAPLAGAWYALSGDPRAVVAGAELVAALGGHVLALRDDPDTAARYHGAATLLAGGTVALFAAAERLLEGLAPDEDVTRAFHALLQSAVSNLAELPPAEALTGPVARGEVGVVEEHLAALDRTSPEAAAAYRALGKVMLGLRDPAAGARADAGSRLGRLFDEAGGRGKASPGPGLRAED